MFHSTSRNKSVNNIDTGIDVSVPAVLEVEAPLGGTSIEYEISVVTNLPSYKAKLQEDSDVVHFSVQKAYREVEDFYNKVSAKLCNERLPAIPKGRSTLKYSPEEKRVSLDNLMKCIAENKEICHSSLFQQFIGLNRLKQQKSDSSSPECATPDSHIMQSNRNSIISVQNDDNMTHSKSLDLLQASEVIGNTDNISELFPKMKVRKSSKSDPLDEQHYVTTNTTSKVKNEDTLASEDIDIFEEVKQIKEVKNKETQLFDSERKLHNALFEPPEDDTDLFRVNSPTPSKDSTKTAEKTISSRPLTKHPKFNTKSANSTKGGDMYKTSCFSEKEKVKDNEPCNENILEDSFDRKKFGNISLFQEQDLGLCITKEDEDLFYIPKGEGKKSKTNPFLSPTSDSSDNDVVESLDELTTVEDPSLPLLPKQSEIEKVVDSDKKKDVPSTETFAETLSGDSVPKKAPPPVVPRKGSLPKPSVPPKPTLPPKPKTGPKPSIRPKPSHLTEFQKDELVVEKPSGTVQDFSSIDIMQYIEQEQKTASAAETSLFD